jgi:hypothetical protein
MYPKVVIKASFPKTQGLRVKIANEVSSVFDKCLCAKQQSHEQRRAIRPLTHWLKKNSDEKRVTPENARGSKRPMTKKRHQKNASTSKIPPIIKEHP